MEFRARIRDAFLEVWKKQQLALANLTGNAFLLFLVITLRTPGPMVVGGLFGLWLMGATLAAFHTTNTETPFGPILRRMHYFLPWALAMAAAVILFGWLASVLHFLVWVLGVAAVIAILPLVSQAAGGGFSRAAAVRIITNDQYWMTGAILLIVGLYIPFMLLSWVPGGDEFLIRALVAGVRFGLSYVLAMISWLTLVAFVGAMGVEFESGARAAPPATEPAL